MRAACLHVVEALAVAVLLIVAGCAKPKELDLDVLRDAGVETARPMPDGSGSGGSANGSGVDAGGLLADGGPELSSETDGSSGVTDAPVVPDMGSSPAPVPPACSSGLADCNQDRARDGCEVVVTTDINHCGGCGLKCSDRNIQPLCSAGACTGQCSSGWQDCNNNKATDGCETNIASDVTHCGGCESRCPARPGGSAVCNAGRCDFECTNPNFPRKCLEGVPGCHECCEDSHCSAPVNYRGACMSRKCVNVCDATTCGDRCVPRGMCYALYVSDECSDTWGNPCSPPSCGPSARSEVRSVFVQGTTVASVSAACESELPRLARAICGSNPDVISRRGAGEEVRIDFYIGLFDRSGGQVEVGTRGSLTSRFFLCP